MSAASRLYLEHCADMAAKIEEGTHESMGFYFELSEMISELEKAKEQILPYATNEANAYDPKELKAMGISYTPDGRGRANYSHIPQWQAAKAELVKIEAWAKAANLAEISYSKPILTKSKTK